MSVAGRYAQRGISHASAHVLQASMQFSILLFFILLLNLIFRQKHCCPFFSFAVAQYFI